METDRWGTPVEHLGGGAYAADVGNGVELRANHHEHPTDKVWLDNNALDALLRFRERVRQWRKGEDT